jgi:hypothetical protein
MLRRSRDQNAYCCASWLVVESVFRHGGDYGFYAGCVSPVDARYASSLARKSVRNRIVSWEPVAARSGDGYTLSDPVGAHHSPEGEVVSPFFIL